MTKTWKPGDRVVHRPTPRFRADLGKMLTGVVTSLSPAYGQNWSTGQPGEPEPFVVVALDTPITWDAPKTTGPIHLTELRVLGSALAPHQEAAHD
jgi:hypothetical protein